MSITEDEYLSIANSTEILNWFSYPKYIRNELLEECIIPEYNKVYEKFKQDRLNGIYWKHSPTVEYFILRFNMEEKR